MMTGLMRASFQSRLAVRGDGIAPPTKIGEVHHSESPQFFSEDNESTLHDRYAVVVLEVGVLTGSNIK